MAPEEADTKINELEHRVERLRSLYEQYFMGIERIEPLVPRKDVDRRIYELRRAKLRNTARRFRLQTVIQRYNTFSQYWMRTCREIENGTYRRHRLKARRRFGDLAPDAPAGETPDDASALEDSAAARDVAGGDSGASDSGAIDSGASDSGAPSNLELADLGAQAALAPNGQRSAAAQQARATAAAEQDLAALLASELDADRAIEEAFAALQSPADSPPGVMARKPAAPPRPPPRRPPTRVVASSLPAPNAALAQPGSGSRDRSSRGDSSASTVKLAVTLPDQTPTRPKRHEAPEPRRRVERTSNPRDDVEQIHQRLEAARRQLNQGGGVSLANLEKTLRATEEKLLAKHPGRRVEFRVAISNGKAGLKPVIK